jgi:hypothetical protein
MMIKSFEEVLWIRIQWIIVINWPPRSSSGFVVLYYSSGSSRIHNKLAFRIQIRNSGSWIYYGSQLIRVKFLDESEFRILGSLQLIKDPDPDLDPDPAFSVSGF